MHRNTSQHIPKTCLTLRLMRAKCQDMSCHVGHVGHVETDAATKSARPDREELLQATASRMQATKCGTHHMLKPMLCDATLSTVLKQCHAKSESESKASSYAAGS